jgi:hypothetical protein
MVFSIINFVFNDHFPFPDGPEGAFIHLGFPPYLVFLGLLTVSYVYFEKSHSLAAAASSNRR